jgi:uncharacterized membrane protein
VVRDERPSGPGERRPIGAGEASTSLDAVPQPWSYNPSSWRQRITVAAIAFVAFLIATYLTLYQWRVIDSVWDPVFGAQSALVLDSEVSVKMRSWLRIPDAALGAIAYLSDVIFALAGCTRRWQYRPWLVVLFGLDVIPIGGVSAILVFMQAFVVGSYCFLCLVTAALSLLLIWLSYDEVWSCLLYLHRYWKRTRNFKALWNVFWGRADIEAARVAAEMAKAA